MSGFTRDEIIRGLRAQNVPLHMAEAAADRQLAELARDVRRTPAAGSRMYPGMTERIDAVLDDIERQGRAELEAPKPAIEWPVRLLLPWSVLISDNERKEPYPVCIDGKWYARMRLTSEYSKAKQQIQNIAKGKLGDAQAATVPLELTARVWVPLGVHWKNDVPNFAKGVHDALEGIVYRNDNLLHAVHWLRCGVDVDAPRAELTIAPLPSSGG